MPTIPLQPVYRLLSLLGMWAWFATALLSQPFQLSFNNINQANGLIYDKYNYFFSQDSRGFIWVGSTKGLNRLDGTNIKQYTYSKEDSTSLPELLIQSPMYEDKNADLWFSSMHYLCRYNRIKDNFSTKKIYYKGKLLEGEQRIFFYERPTHSLFLKIANHLYIYHIQTEKTTRLPFTSELKFYVADTTKNGMVKRIYGYGWEIPGIEIFSRNIDGKFNKVTYGRPDEQNKEGLLVKQIIPQNDSIAWLFTRQELIKFNRFHPERIMPLNKIGSDVEFGQLIDSNLLMLTTNNEGLMLFDINDKKIIARWKKNDQQEHTLISNNLRQLFLDREKNLWINTAQNGIICTPLLPAKFFCPKDIQDAKLNFNHISYYNDQLWCIAHQEGIFVFDTDLSLRQKIPNKELSKWGIHLTKHSSFCCATNNKLLLFPRKGCYMLKEDRNSWKVVTNDTEITDVYPLSNNRYLIDNFTRIQSFDLNSESPVVSTIPALADTSWYQTLFFSKYYNKLICSVDGLMLNIYNLDNDTIWLDSSLELKSYVSSIYQDDKTKLIWIGTNIGLWRLNIASNQLSHISIFSDHFPIQKIIGDQEGNIWCAGTKGLICYSPHTDKTITFTKDDGFLSNSFNENAGCKDSNGNVYFCSNKGITCFSPKKVAPYPYSPHVYIKNLRVNNLPYEPKDTVVNEKSLFYFSPSENTLHFELSNCNFYLPLHVKTFFRLRGISDEWEKYDPQEKALFAGLSPGKYRLEWKTFNANGVESPVEGVSVVIPPHFYQTTGFILFAILFSGGLIFLATRIYYKQKLKRQQRTFEKQKAIQEERNRIGDELHDDLGSGLSLIRVLSQMIEGKIHDPKLSKRVGQISNTSELLLQNMKDILWAMDTKNNSLNNLLIRVKEYVKTNLPPHQINYRCESKKLEKDIELQSAKRRNIYLIVKESLHNIIKHADATMVKIKMEVKGKNLNIVIQDNGKGMDVDNIKSAGKGLKSMKKRTRDAGGKIIFESEHGKGTTIRIEIPLSNKKAKPHS